MGLEYLLPFTINLSHINVGKYSSPMGHMGLLMNRNFPHGTFQWDFLVTTLYQIGQSQVEVAILHGLKFSELSNEKRGPWLV